MRCSLWRRSGARRCPIRAACSGTDQDLLQRYPGQTALAQAVDTALHDAGKREGKPLHELWASPEGGTGFFVHNCSGYAGRDAGKSGTGTGLSILKVKTGGQNDPDMLHAIHKRSGKPLYVDANEGWSAGQTLEYLPHLADCQVRMLEQPLPRDQREGYRQIQERNPTQIPIFIDEGVHGPDDILSWVGLVDGINIKLAKCGGLARARQMIDLARAHSLQIMLGCMIESSLGITAAAHLAPLVDFIDLDGAALLADDPFVGMWLERGRLIMPGGLGLERFPATLKSAQISSHHQLIVACLKQRQIAEKEDEQNNCIQDTTLENNKEKRELQDDSHQKGKNINDWNNTQNQSEQIDTDDPCYQAERGKQFQLPVLIPFHIRITKVYRQYRKKY